MGTPKILEQNERGQTRVEGNALIQDSLIDDAAEVRVGGPNGGKFSVDVVIRAADGTVISRKAIAEITCGEGIFGAELTLSVLKKGGASVDGDMIKAIRITEQDGIELLLPVTGGRPAPAGPRRVALRSIATGVYVSADLTRGAWAPLVADRPDLGPWEQFELVEL